MSDQDVLSKLKGVLWPLDVACQVGSCLLLISYYQYYELKLVMPLFVLELLIIAKEPVKALKKYTYYKVSDLLTLLLFIAHLTDSLHLHKLILLVPAIM